MKLLCSQVVKDILGEKIDVSGGWVAGNDGRGWESVMGEGGGEWGYMYGSGRNTEEG